MAAKRKTRQEERNLDEPVRVATYRRISTNEKNQPYSLEAQERSLGQYVKSQPNWELCADFVDMQTATNNQRPGLESLLADARAGRFDVVLVYRLDRIVRTVAGMMEILAALDEGDVKFRSATEPFDTLTPSGKMGMQMVSVIAEFEHDVFIDRIVEGFQTKALRGEWLSGPAPFGYSLDKARKSLTINNAEAPVVRKIYELYGEGHGATSVAETLNNAGYRTRTNCRWNAQGVLRVLAAPVHVGKIFHLGDVHPGIHEAVIDDELFNKVAAIRLARNSSRKARSQVTTTSDFILTGLISCGVCGAPYIGARAHGSSKRTYRYYVCSARSNGRGDGSCDNERIDADATEQMIIEEIVKAYEDSTLFDRALETALENVPGQLTALQDEGRAIQATLEKSNASLERYFNAFEAGTLNAIDLSDRMSTLKLRIQELKAEERRVATEIANLAGSSTGLVDLSKMLSKVAEVLRRTDNTVERKRCVAGLVQSVTVQRDRVIQPVLRVPTMSPGSEAKAIRSHKRTKRGNAKETENSQALVGPAVSEFSDPVRMGYQVVEVPGIEPGSFGTSVSLLRAQPAKNCRG